MSPDYDTIYDYASMLPRMGEAVEGSAAQLHPNDLILFAARNTGLLICGEVAMTGNHFSVNGVEVGHRDKGVNVVTVKQFWFIPEPDITRFEQFSISHRRVWSFIGWSVQFLGADKQWHEGVISGVSTIGAGSVPDFHIQLVGDKKHHKLAPLISILVTGSTMA